MGSKIVSAHFEPLIYTVCYLALHAGSRTFRGEAAAQLPTYQGVRPLELSKTDELLLLDTNFYDKSLREGIDGESLGKLATHWSYDDYEFSKELCIVLLKGLNDIEYERVKPFYQTLSQILQLQDQYQQLRFEWLFGFAVPKHVRKTDSVYPYYGSAQIHYIDDEVFSFCSPLFYGPACYETVDSILTLLWRSKRRYDAYCITVIKLLFEICNQCQALKDFIAKQPPVTYQYARYTGWIQTFIENYLDECKKTSGYYYVSTFRNLELGEYVQEQFNMFRQGSVEPPKVADYVIGKTQSSRIISSEVIAENVTLDWTEYTLPYKTSWPTGDGNTALQQYKTRQQSFMPSIITSRTTKPASVGGKKTKQGDEEAEEESTDEMVAMESPTSEVGGAPIALQEWDPTTSTWKKETQNNETQVSNEPVITVQEPQGVQGEEEEEKDEPQELADLILRASINNQTSKNVKVTLNVQSQGNVTCPKSGLVSTILPRTIKEVCTLMKDGPDLEWDVTWTHELEEAEASSSPQFSTLVQNVNTAIMTQDISIGPVYGPIPLQDITRDDTAVEVACPSCTYLNNSISLRCEICGSMLPS